MARVQRGGRSVVAAAGVAAADATRAFPADTPLKSGPNKTLRFKRSDSLGPCFSMGSWIVMVTGFKH